jgi:Protein of unknown function (DUF3570)
VKGRPAAPACRAAAVVANRAIAIVAVAVILALVGATYSRAQSELNVQFHHFQDTRGVTVLSPTVDLSQDFTDRTTLRASFGVDAISAASDSCARCHRQGVNSQRRVASASISRKFGDLKWTIGGEYSQENFYKATTALTSFSRDLNSGSTTVAGGYTFSVNQPTLHPLPQVEQQFANSGYVAVTQTLTKTAVAQVGYEVAQVNGFQSNPFLRADVQGVMLVGHSPDLRTRQTLTARVRQALPGDTYLEANYRHYFDTWQLRSNSLDVGLSRYFTKAVLANFVYRRYNQTGAFFYQPKYDSVPQYFTADFRLEPFASGLYTGKLLITPAAPFRLPKGSRLLLQYDRYRADNGFEAGTLTGGLRIPLKLTR